MLAVDPLAMFYPPLGLQNKPEHPQRYPNHFQRHESSSVTAFGIEQAQSYINSLRDGAKLQRRFYSKKVCLDTSGGVRDPLMVASLTYQIRRQLVPGFQKPLYWTRYPPRPARRLNSFERLGSNLEDVQFRKVTPSSKKRAVKIRCLQAWSQAFSRFSNSEPNAKKAASNIKVSGQANNIMTFKSPDHVRNVLKGQTEQRNKYRLFDLLPPNFVNHAVLSSQINFQPMDDLQLRQSEAYDQYPTSFPQPPRLTAPKPPCHSSNKT